MRAQQQPGPFRPAPICLPALTGVLYCADLYRASAKSRRCAPIGVAADRVVGDNKTGDVKTWQASVGSSAPLLDDNSKGILFSLVDRAGAESVPASLDDWQPATTLYEKRGWKRYGDVLVRAMHRGTLSALLCGSLPASALLAIALLVEQCLSHKQTRPLARCSCGPSSY